MEKIQWKANNVDNAKHLGILEFQDRAGEYHTFDVLETPERLVFGGACNVGFLESGYIEKDGFDADATLEELLADLEVYYNAGPRYVSAIVCNERM